MIDTDRMRQIEKNSRNFKHADSFKPFVTIRESVILGHNMAPNMLTLYTKLEVERYFITIYEYYIFKALTFIC